MAKINNNEDLTPNGPDILPNPGNDMTGVGINCPRCNFFIKVSLPELLSSEITCPACGLTIKMNQKPFSLNVK